MIWYSSLTSSGSKFAAKLQKDTPVILNDGSLGRVWADWGEVVDVFPAMTRKMVRVRKEDLEQATAQGLGLTPGDQGRVVGMGQQLFTFESENPNGTINVRSEDGRSMRPNLSKFQPL